MMQYIFLFFNLCEEKEKCKDKDIKGKEEKLNIKNFLGTRLFQD